MKRGLWITLIVVLAIVLFVILNLNKSYSLPLPRLVLLDFLNDPINRLFAGPIDTSCNVDSDCVVRFVNCHGRCIPVNKNNKYGYCPFKTNNPSLCPARITDVRCVNNECKERL